MTRTHESTEVLAKKKLSTRTRAMRFVGGVAAAGALMGVAGCAPGTAEAKNNTQPVAVAPVDPSEIKPAISKIDVIAENETTSDSSEFEKTLYPVKLDLTGDGTKETYETEKELSSAMSIDVAKYPTVFDQQTHLANIEEAILNEPDTDTRNVLLRHRFETDVISTAKNGAILQYPPDDGTDGTASLADRLFSMADEVAAVNKASANPAHVTFSIHKTFDNTGYATMDTDKKTNTTYVSTAYDLKGLSSRGTVTYVDQGAYQVQDGRVKVIGMNEIIKPQDSL